MLATIDRVLTLLHSSFEQRIADMQKLKNLCEDTIIRNCQGLVQDSYDRRTLQLSIVEGVLTQLGSAIDAPEQYKFRSALVSFVANILEMPESIVTSLTFGGKSLEKMDVQTLDEVLLWGYFADGPKHFAERRRGESYIYRCCVFIVDSAMNGRKKGVATVSTDAGLLRIVLSNAQYRCARDLRQPYFLDDFYSALISYVINQMDLTVNISDIRFESDGPVILRYIADVNYYHQVAFWCYNGSAPP
jgi:hypothetical protein